MNISTFDGFFDLEKATTQKNRDLAMNGNGSNKKNITMLKSEMKKKFSWLLGPDKSLKPQELTSPICVFKQNFTPPQNTFIVEKIERGGYSFPSAVFSYSDSNELSYRSQIFFMRSHCQKLEQQIVESPSLYTSHMGNFLNNLYMCDCR